MPLLIRFILGFIIGAFYIGLVGVIMYVAINNNSIVLFVVAILVAVIVAYGFGKIYIKIKSK